MHKVTKILLKALSVTILFLIFCPIVLTLLVELPSVQNYLIGRATSFLSERLETRVSIDRIRLGALGSLRVDGFYVEDYQQDTLLYVGIGGIAAVVVLAAVSFPPPKISTIAKISATNPARMMPIFFISTFVVITIIKRPLL